MINRFIFGLAALAISAGFWSATASAHQGNPDYRSEGTSIRPDRDAEVDIPARADADRAPDWKEVDRSGQFAWHDHRSHYMGEGTPPQVTDESAETVIFDYSIPISVDGDRASLDGTLTWVGGDSGIPPAPFIGLGVLLLLGAGWLLLRRNRAGPDTPTAPGS